MKLWNDYEGKTLDNRYTLGSLLRPEGRSALFTFTEGPGSPAIIRITESLNDEGEMMANWRRIRDLKQDHLLNITDFGETVFEGTPLTYAVLEPTDANLDELLATRALTQPEAMQIAGALVSSLAALHASELVHEHIGAENLFAVGETVKLRADCVRRVVVDGEFTTVEDRARLVRQDIHDLGFTLLRGLTLEKKLRPGLILPAPFDKVVPNALNGSWSLEQIARLVLPPAPVKPAAPARPVAATVVTTPAAVAQALPGVPAVKPASTVPSGPAAAGPSAAAVSAAVRSAPVRAAASATAPEAVAASLPPAAQATLPYAEAKSESGTSSVSTMPEQSSGTEQPATVVSDNPLLFQRRIQVPTVDTSSGVARWKPLSIAAAALIAFLLYIVHGSSSAKPQAALNTTSAQTTTQVAQRSATPAAAPVQPVARPVAATPAETRPTVAERVQPGWYVIAYTFNHEEQALKRAAAIVRRYPGLRPQVIAPGGNGYLVALGGAMSRNEAEAIRNHARRAGMPRDTFVRNYGS